MFKGWIGQVRIKQQHLSSLTLSNVMERWKAKASTSRDLQDMAERWSRRRTLRQFWKEWFFHTCSVKTVQYYQIKLKQRTLGQWLFRFRRSQKMRHHAIYMWRRKISILAWSRWRANVQAIEAQVENVDRRWRYQVMSASLQTWRRNQQLSLRGCLLGDQVNNRLIVHAWKKWRDTTYANINSG